MRTEKIMSEIKKEKTKVVKRAKEKTPRAPAVKAAAKPKAVKKPTVKSEARAVKKTVRAKRVLPAAPAAGHAPKPHVAHKKITASRFPLLPPEVLKPIVPKVEVKKPEVAKVEIPEPVIPKPEAPRPVVPKPEIPRPEIKAPPAAEKELELKLPITVKDLAIKLQDKPSNLIKILMGMGLMAGMNNALTEADVITVCQKYGFKIKHALDEEQAALSIHTEKDLPESLKPRSPIVTFMGHVDHGKTSLLDAIKKSKVAEAEHGGITQHIGAYRVNLPHGEITFLDTPGHEAFTAMRARGASVTDIVVLVVAADDGIMPQTQEAIDHARAAGVSIIVAVNKIDKPGADIDRVKKQLAGLGLTAEDWGGKTITAPVSAKTGEGIDNLLEMILLEAQMLELKANPNRLAAGVVLEGKLVKSKGPMATLLVQKGTLRLNDNIIVGKCYGKVKAMFDHLGRNVSEAPPSCPVEVLGISDVPQAGEQFFVIADEKTAKELAAKRQEKEKELQLKPVKRMGLEDLYSQIKEGKLKELKLILKADMRGSLEAIKDTIGKLNISEVRLDIIHEGIGNVNNSDVVLALASNALILGFNVVVDEQARELIAKEGQDVRLYNVIYELANDIKTALEGMLEPKLKKVFLGKVEIRKVMKLTKAGIVAGSFVMKGRINRGASVTLVRSGQVVYEGQLSSLKRFKDDVREVEEGFECGLTLKGFADVQEGDIIEAYEIQKIARTL